MSMNCQHNYRYILRCRLIFLYNIILIYVIVTCQLNSNVLSTIHMIFTQHHITLHNCDSSRTFQWHFNISITFQYFHTIEITLKCNWNSNELPLEFPWNSIGIPLELIMFFTNSLEFHWNSIGISSEFHRNSIGIPLELIMFLLIHWNFIGIPWEFHWN